MGHIFDKIQSVFINLKILRTYVPTISITYNLLKSSTQKSNCTTIY